MNAFAVAEKGRMTMADMRERLIELMLNAPQIPCTKGGRATGKRYQTFQNIADHLLANGVIVLPCKVGDRIYRIIGDDFIYWEIVKIKIYADEIGLIDDSDNWCSLEDIGKTIFLTKAEAEQALKERDSNV
jgi:hypothetical protein